MYNDTKHLPTLVHVPFQHAPVNVAFRLLPFKTPARLCSSCEENKKCILSRYRVSTMSSNKVVDEASIKHDLTALCTRTTCKHASESSPRETSLFMNCVRWHATRNRKKRYQHIYKPRHKADWIKTMLWKMGQHSTKMTFMFAKTKKELLL